MEVSPNSLQPGQDLPGFHAGAGGPGRVFHRHDEHAPVDAQRAQVPAELGADQLVPAGEHRLHHGRGRGRAQPARAAGAWTRPPAGGRVVVAAVSSPGLQALHREEPGHRDPLGQRRRRGEDRLARRQLGHQGAAAGRVELGEDVVEEQGRDQRRPGRGSARARPGAGPGPGSVARPARRGSGPPCPSISSRRSSRWGPTVLTPRRRSSLRRAASASSRSPSQLRT